MSVALEPSIFGRIVTGGDVEDWLTTTCQKWVGTYLAEVERQHGLVAGTIARPRSWGTAPSVDKWPEDQLPGVVVVSVGISENPHADGAGQYRARWASGLACICSARTQAESRRMSMLYVAALRTLILQRQSLEGRAAGVEWIDENYDDLLFDDGRTLAVGQAVFTVQVNDVATEGAGPITPADPLVPDTDPWADWPTVQTADSVLENKLTNGGS